MNISKIVSDKEAEAIIRYVKRCNSYLSNKLILRAIELCKMNSKDNLGQSIANFYELVYYRANQIWLACGNIYG